MYEVIIYTTESGQAPFSRYLEKLGNSNHQREVDRIFAYITRLMQLGMQVNNTYPQTIRSLGNDLYELRPGDHRVLFFYFTGNKFVLLHAFRKTTNKTPRNEIERAKNEMNDFKRRNTDG